MMLQRSHFKDSLTARNFEVPGLNDDLERDDDKETAEQRQEHLGPKRDCKS